MTIEKPNLFPVCKNYKTPYDTIDRWDKYAEILGNSKKINVARLYGNKFIIQKILDHNDVIVWEEKGQHKFCVCGSRLDYSDKILLSWLEGGCSENIQISGKYCHNCGKKYVVRKNLLVAIKDS